MKVLVFFVLVSFSVMYSLSTCTLATDTYYCDTSLKTQIRARCVGGVSAIEVRIKLFSREYVQRR